MESAFEAGSRRGLDKETQTQSETVTVTVTIRAHTSNSESNTNTNGNGNEICSSARDFRPLGYNRVRMSICSLARSLARLLFDVIRVDRRPRKWGRHCEPGQQVRRPSTKASFTSSYRGHGSSRDYANDASNCDKSSRVSLVALVGSPG